MLHEATGVALAEEDLLRLEERTDGWAAAVQLVGLSLRGHEDAASVVDAFTGDNRHIADYLRDEVLARLRDRLRGLHPCHGVPRPADGATLRGRRGRR